MQTVSLSLYRFASLGARLWAFAQMGLARRGFAKPPGIGYWKLCGSGPAALASGPLAALTRATVRPGAAARFWRRVPDISAMIGTDPNVLFKIGIGEVPLLHQVTFSIWPDADSMARFARRDGPHARAIAAVRSEGWFREELYARFRVLGTAGRWEGGNPLANLPGLTARSERTAA